MIIIIESEKDLNWFKDVSIKSLQYPITIVLKIDLPSKYTEVTLKNVDSSGKFSYTLYTTYKESSPTREEFFYRSGVAETNPQTTTIGELFNKYNNIHLLWANVYAVKIKVLEEYTKYKENLYVI